MASSLLLALGIAVAVGGAATAWLWLMHRPKAECANGLQLLSAMRWRELSRLIVEGLRERGFEPEAAEDAAERGQDSVLHLRREGRTWLLACKQGIQYRITPTIVGDMNDAMRFHGAVGGVVATPGTVDPQARRLAAGRMELIDGAALWPMVRPQLAPGVQEEVVTAARRAAVRHGVLAWTGALLVGVAVAALLPSSDLTEEDPGTPTVLRNSPVEAAAVSMPPDTLAAPPASEEEQRDEIVRQVSALPGVTSVLWTTRSTLMVSLADDKADPVKSICAIVERYEALRTSRLHLQLPADAARPARFLQCRTF